MAQDRTLGLPRLGGALAGPWAAARRLGGGASAEARSGGDDESQLILLLFLPGTGLLIERPVYGWGVDSCCC